MKKTLRLLLPFFAVLPLAAAPEPPAAPARQIPFPPGPPVLPPELATVTIEATVPDAYEANDAKGFFTVRRIPAADLAGLPALTVAYGVGGTAVGGTQYRVLPGSVIIPEGESKVRIKVIPLDDGATGHDSTVKLTLAPGDGYEVGDPGKAKVKIHDAPGR